MVNDMPEDRTASSTRRFASCSSYLTATGANDTYTKCRTPARRAAATRASCPSPSTDAIESPSRRDRVAVAVVMTVVLAPLAEARRELVAVDIAVDRDVHQEIHHDDRRDDFDGYPLWIAHYLQKERPSIYREWAFWQHSEAGRVNGIVTRVDFDVFSGDSAEFRKLLLN